MSGSRLPRLVTLGKTTNRCASWLRSCSARKARKQSVESLHASWSGKPVMEPPQCAAWTCSQSRVCSSSRLTACPLPLPGLGKSAGESSTLGFPSADGTCERRKGTGVLKSLSRLYLSTQCCLRAKASAGGQQHNTSVRVNYCMT